MTNIFLDLFKTIENRKISKDKNSYTSKLLKEGEKKIAQKFGEEGAELIIDYLRGTKKRTIEEASDVIYHLFVLLSSKKISYSDIKKELSKRKNVRRK
jgi:phosphoribosyl-ATP pyrophosphohydrolase